jgi:hypothetical protein
MAHTLCVCVCVCVCVWRVCVCVCVWLSLKGVTTWHTTQLAVAKCVVKCAFVQGLHACEWVCAFVCACAVSA